MRLAELEKIKKLANRRPRNLNQLDRKKKPIRIWKNPDEYSRGWRDYAVIADQNASSFRGGRFLAKSVSVFLLMGLNLLGLNNIMETKAAFQDAETSTMNQFGADKIDFSLNSNSNFYPQCLGNNTVAVKTISIENQGSQFSYTASGTDFSSALCDYAQLEANLNGNELEYQGNLTSFHYGPVAYSEADKWVFRVSFPGNLPSLLQGQKCDFKIRFFGNQPEFVYSAEYGFTDIEINSASFQSSTCHTETTRSKGYWKNHPDKFLPLLPQQLGGHPNDHVINSESDVRKIFNEYNLSMRNKLMGQLLALKFNISQFQIGSYDYENGRTLNDLADQADNLLRQNPPPSSNVLECLKNKLEYWNNDRRIKVCNCQNQDEQPQKVLISKVYYDVDPWHGLDSGNEWVEIYNPIDAPIDISGWKICNHNACAAIPESDSIPAGGYALISASSTTWGYWEIPPEVVKISLNSLSDSILGNDGDRVLLQDDQNRVVDDMSYGSDEFAFTPACPDIVTGHMLGRLNSEPDTDTAADFHDLGLPTVQVLVPNGGEVWYIGRIYELKWQAHNQNGPDIDLKIDLYYSNDSGQSWARIATSTENDGSYYWRTPLFLENNYSVMSSRARIKVVARGPENFMIAGVDTSDSDFCPPIDYELLLPEEVEMLIKLGLFDPVDAERETTSSSGQILLMGNDNGDASSSPEVVEIEPTATSTFPVSSSSDPMLPDSNPTASTSAEIEVAFGADIVQIETSSEENNGDDKLGTDESNSMFKDEHSLVQETESVPDPNNGNDLFLSSGEAITNKEEGITVDNSSLDSGNDEDDHFNANDAIISDQISGSSDDQVEDQ